MAISKTEKEYVLAFDLSGVEKKPKFNWTEGDRKWTLKGKRKLSIPGIQQYCNIPTGKFEQHGEFPACVQLTSTWEKKYLNGMWIISFPLVTTEMHGDRSSQSSQENQNDPKEGQ